MWVLLEVFLDHSTPFLFTQHKGRYVAQKEPKWAARVVPRDCSAYRVNSAVKIGGRPPPPSRQ